MINIFVNGIEMQVNEGTRVIDLLKQEDRRKYAVCKLGSQIKELNRKLSSKDDGKTIEFLGIENNEAAKAYEASLRYIVAMAFHNLYPDVRIRFGYNASRSIFCQILTKGFNVSKATDEIRKEVDRIIKADMPIERITVSTDEAREIFEKMQRDDKLRILPYRPESLVNIYVCGDYYDYLHAYMVPSTGCIFSYNLMPYSPGIIIQYPRSELNAEIPEFVEEIRPVKLEKKAQQIYDGIDKDSFAELMSGEVTARNVLTRLLRLSQCTGGFIRDDEGGVVQEVSKAKLEALEDIIDECMEQGKKVVVFARFVPEIDSIAKMLQKKKIGYALIKGDVTDRAEQVDAFQNDPDTKVFIGQLQTTGMGLTLTAGTVAVYYSLDFSYANYEQSRARIRRIGQTKRGVYIHLVCKDTIDEKVMAALKQKADVSKLLVDDYKTLIGG